MGMLSECFQSHSKVVREVILGRTTPTHSEGERSNGAAASGWAHNPAWLLGYKDQACSLAVKLGFRLLLLLQFVL